MDNRFRERLKHGDVLLGTLVSLPCPAVVEIMREIGFDWLFVDAEHGPLDVAEAQALLQAAGDTLPCLIRVPSDDEVYIKKALDIGAAGIIVPQVNSAEQAERVVRFCKYAPEGSRGVGIARAHRYGLRFQDYIEQANAKLAVIIQVEHRDAVANIEAITRVAGIDAVFVGPYDLSASLGKIGQVTAPEVVDAVAQVGEACLNAGLRLGIFGLTAVAVKPYLEQGYTLIAVGVDSLLLAQAAKALMAEFKDS